MRVKQMIFIDKVFGPIICCLLYVLQSFNRILKDRSSSDRYGRKINKILIMKFWGMGSILLATPAIHNLKKRYPDSEIIMVTLKQNQRFCRLIKCIDRIVVFSPSPGHLFIFNFLKLINKIKREEVDLLIDLEFGVNFSAIVSFFVKAKEKIGFDAAKYWRGKLYVKKIPFDHGRHISMIFNKMIRSIDGFPSDELSFEDIYEIDTENERRFIDRLHDQYKVNNDDCLIVLNINASSLNQNRRWPLEYYVDLSSELIKDKKNKILAIGSQEDRDYVKKFVSHFLSNNIIDLSGKLEIEELIFLIKNCNIFIGNDSGPLHIAYTFNRPTISFFGPETPMLYGPPNNRRHVVFYKDIYCSPCLNIYNSKAFICHDNQCLKQISPGEVKEQIRKILPL